VSFAEQAAVETDNDRSVQRALGIALVEGGRLEDGIDVLRQLAGGTGDPTANGDLGWALMAADRAEEALTSFEQALGATLQDPWMLSQTARVLTDIGEFEQAMELANWSMETADESADAWARIGWAAQHLDPPDHARGEQAFDRAWSLQPDGQQDPWVLSCRADSRHVLGDERAREDYETALELARMRRINGIWPLSVIGWCQFRLGDLSAAARTFVEVRSIEEKPGSDVLDLALVTLCHGRSKRALRMYEDAVHLLSTRSGLIQRGLLKVAIVDLQRAPIDFPELKSGPELETATNLLTYALANLPRPPALRLPPDLGGGR
jgi:tetratricopeptide (TPR) repeat protein